MTTLPSEIDARRTTCSSCGAPVMWVTTAKGRMMPCDVEPRDDGNLAIVGAESHAYSLEDAMHGRPRFVSHFASCPQAPEWRKQGDDNARGKPPTSTRGEKGGGGMKCRVKGCTSRHRTDQVACFRHWTSLPKHVRDEIWRLYRAEDGSEEHVRAVYAALASLNEKEAERG